MGEQERIVSREGLELVGGRDERVPGPLRQLHRHAGAELGMGIQAGADGRPAERQLAEMGDRFLDVIDALVEEFHPAGDLLTEGQRSRVHQVRPADLDDVLEGFGLSGQSVAERLDRGNQAVSEHLDGRHVHGRREHVVG